MKRINITRPFHGDAYDATIHVNDNMQLSATQVRKIKLHHRRGYDCQCPVYLNDDDGNAYGYFPSVHGNGYELFEV
jgi:hypothetical protein